jgi:hypothetical protein
MGADATVAALVNKLLLAGACGALSGASLSTPVGGSSAASQRRSVTPTPTTVPFSEFSSEPPRAPLRLLFIHHSVGGRLLADAGPKARIAEEIWKSHPEGGGLRRLLEAQGYQVHQASYGSDVGNHTDRGDWLAKFRDKMDRGLSCALNDQPLPDGQRNHIVLWKSCFDNLITDGSALHQARASLSALLPIFAQRPEVLFVHLTTPPVAPKTPKQPVWKWLARAALGKPQPGFRLAKSGPLARQLNDWVTSPDGWLKDYPHKNLVVFDLYDILTEHGKSDFLAYATGGGYDSHPSRAGNQLVAGALVPFLNRAVRRAGLSD